MKRRIDAAMQQLNAVLNEYADRTRGAPGCGFSTYFSCWATLRMEQAAKAGR